MQRQLSFKTFLLSQFIILIVGLVSIGILYRLLNPEIKKSTLENYLPVTIRPAQLFLEVANPEDELLTFDKNIIISGKTLAGTTVIISTNNSSDSGLQANLKGEFSKVISLSLGINDLTITALDNKGNKQITQRTIYYSEEKL